MPTVFGPMPPPDVHATRIAAANENVSSKLESTTAALGESKRANLFLSSPDDIARMKKTYKPLLWGEHDGDETTYSTRLQEHLRLVVQAAMKTESDRERIINYDASLQVASDRVFLDTLNIQSYPHSAPHFTEAFGDLREYGTTNFVPQLAENRELLIKNAAEELKALAEASLELARLKEEGAT